MGKSLTGLYLSLFTLVFCSLAHADQVKFDDTFAGAEKEICLKNEVTETAYKAWLIGEIKKLTDGDPLTGTTIEQIWDRDPIAFRIDGVPQEFKWEPKSPGTFGKINNSKINFSNSEDGKTLRAPIVDVAEGVLADLNNLKNLENKIWLVEQSDLIPSIVALSMEAKLHKALALIVFGEDKANLDAPGALAVLPIVRVSEVLGRELKKKIKEKEMNGELSSRAEFPKNKTKDWVALKKGPREIRLAVTANYGDCGAVADLLGILDWLKKSPETNIQGTIFGFVADDKSGLGQIASEIKVESSTFKPSKFLKDWLHSDQALADLIGGKAIVKQALMDAGNFTGLVDKEILIQYKTNLKKLESIVKAQPEIAFQLKIIYANTPSDLALDLKTLRQVHQFAQRGQWEKAVNQFQKISDYEWASNVSAPIFIEYYKSLSGQELRIDPALWGQLQQGRGHLDGFIEAVEIEIDRVDKKLSDNFFKMYKSVENLDKI